MTRLTFAVVLLATGVMRLAEVSVSRRRLREGDGVALGEPVLFPVMVLLHVGLIFGPMAEVVLLDRPFVPLLAAIAAAVLVLASALRIWTLRTIGRAWNVRVVAPDDGAIATTGPYAFIRHPNYLAVILEILSLPLLHTAWISSVVLSTVNAVVLFHRIRTEERVLEASPTWREAMSDRARLIPGLF